MLVNGKVGVLASIDDEYISLMAFTISQGLITEINVLVDPVRLAELNLTSQ